MWIEYARGQLNPAFIFAKCCAPDGNFVADTLPWAYTSLHPDDRTLLLARKHVEHFLPCGMDDPLSAPWSAPFYKLMARTSQCCNCS